MPNAALHSQHSDIMFFSIYKAMNPCPCGYFTDPHKACRCNPNKIASNMGKISGPLLDRIDIHFCFGMETPEGFSFIVDSCNM